MIWFFFNSQPKGKGIRCEARTIPHTTREEKAMTHETYERKNSKAYRKVQHSVSYVGEAESSK